MSEYDVKHNILSLKRNAAGWDNLLAYFGKQCIDVYITPLTFILNQLMTEGVFPDILKQQESYHYTHLVKIKILIILRFSIYPCRMCLYVYIYVHVCTCMY